MNKKGFTIIELLGVLLVLGVLMVFAWPAIFKTEQAALQKISETELRNLKEAARMVAIDLDDYMTPIYNCKTSSWINKYCTPTNDGTDEDYQWVSVELPIKELVDNKYFEDTSKHCTKNENSKIIIIRQGHKVDLSNVICE